MKKEDFSKGQWILRNSRIAAGIVPMEVSPDGKTAEMGWADPVSGLHWDSDGNHIFTNLGFRHKGNEGQNTLLDLIRPWESLPERKGKVATPRKIFVVTGGSSGLGAAIIVALKAVVDCDVYNLDWSFPDPRNYGDGIYCDLGSEDSIESAAVGLPSRIDALVNCAGVNHIEWFDKLEANDFDCLMSVNARAIFLLSQALLPKLQNGTILNILSDAAYRPMTGTLAYCASKAAAAMITEQMAREFRRTDIPVTVFGIAPGKIANTGMTGYVDGRVPELRGWSAEEAERYARTQLTQKRDIPKELLAEFIAYLLVEKERHEFFHGHILPYGG